MLMYKRDETIADERLNWDKDSTTRANEKELDVVKPYEPRPQKPAINEESQLAIEPPKQSSIQSFLEKYEKLTLISGSLFLPYLMGVLFQTVLFYIYSGVTLDKIFSVNKNPTIFELWTIGAYFFITLWLMGIILKVILGKR